MGSWVRVWFTAICIIASVNRRPIDLIRLFPNPRLPVSIHTNLAAVLEQEILVSTRE